MRVAASEGVLPAEGASVPAGTAAPEIAPAPVTSSKQEAVLAALLVFKNQYGIYIVGLLVALGILYYNWKPQYKPPAANKAADWEEKRRLAVELQQRALQNQTRDFLKREEEAKQREQEKRVQRAEEDIKRMGLQGKFGKGQKLGRAPTEVGPVAAPAEDWLS